MKKNIYYLFNNTAKIIVLLLCIFMLSYGIFYSFLNISKEASQVSASSQGQGLTEKTDVEAKNISTFDSKSEKFLPVANNDTIYSKINQKIDLSVILENDINATGFELVGSADIEDGFLLPIKDFDGEVEHKYVAKLGNKSSNEARIKIVYTDSEIILQDDNYEVYGSSFIDPIQNDVILGDYKITIINEYELKEEVETVYFDKGYLNVNGSEYNFVAYPDIYGKVSFNYQIGGKQATVNLDIKKPKPIVENDYFSINSNTSLKLDVLKNDEDGLVIESFSSKDVDSLGVFTPTKDFKGTVEFKYTVIDNIGQKEEGDIQIEVQNKPPVARPDYISRGRVELSQLLKNDFDLDGDLISLASIGGINISNTNQDIIINQSEIIIQDTSVEFDDKISYVIEDIDGGKDIGYIYIS